MCVRSWWRRTRCVRGWGLSTRPERTRRPAVVGFEVAPRAPLGFDVVPEGVNLLLAPDVDALHEALEFVELVVIEADRVDRRVVEALTVARATNRVPVALRLRVDAAPASALPPSLRPDLILDPEAPLPEARQALGALIAARSTGCRQGGPMPAGRAPGEAWRTREPS